MNTKVYQFMTVGFVSGVISSWVSNYGDGSAIQIVPGVVFGFIAGFTIALFDRKLTFPVFRFLAWIVLSVGSYYAAFWATVTMLDKTGSVGAFFIGGAVGMLLLSIGYYFLYYRFKLSTHLLLVLLGAVLGMLGYLDVRFMHDEKFYEINFPFIILFSIWQMGVAGAIGFLVSKKEKELV
jgi:hypothetical protein